MERAFCLQETKVHTPLAKTGPLAFPRSKEVGKCTDQLGSDFSATTMFYGRWSMSWGEQLAISTTIVQLSGMSVLVPGESGFRPCFCHSLAAHMGMLFQFSETFSSSVKMGIMEKSLSLRVAMELNCGSCTYSSWDCAWHITSPQQMLFLSLTMKKCQHLT